MCFSHAGRNFCFLPPTLNAIATNLLIPHLEECFRLGPELFPALASCRPAGGHTCLTSPRAKPAHSNIACPQHHQTKQHLSLLSSSTASWGLFVLLLVPLSGKLPPAMGGPSLAPQEGVGLLDPTQSSILVTPCK